MDIGDFVARFKKNRTRAGFVLDFDGTLSGIANAPGEAVPVEGAPEILETLSNEYRVVAMVSGRLAIDLEKIVRATGPIYVGLYGAERIERGALVQPAEAERWRGMASRLARDAEALITTEGLEGAVVEYKDLAVSVHYRRARDTRAGEAIRAWAVTAAPRRGFEAAVGRMVVELRPAGVSKASAVERIVLQTGLGFLVVAGDDYQDVDAMRRATELLGDGALRVGVSSNEEPDGIREAADLMVSSPFEVLDLLRKFL